MTAADQPTTEPTTITVPRPHVPHGPEHVTPAQADADYLRAAVRNIKHQSHGERLWGSGVTAMVSKLLNDAADALLAPAPQPAAEPTCGHDLPVLPGGRCDYRQPAADTETEVQWGWCDDVDADPEPHNVKVCESRGAAVMAVSLDPAARVLLCGTPTTCWEEA